MTPEEFSEHYPRLYHMAERGTWDSIKTHGLLSTSALLDLFGVTGERRHRIESCRRKESVPIEHPQYGVATIRDNAPLPETKLRSALDDGTTCQEWYEILNGKVFFWPTKERIARLLRGRRYRGKWHTVIVVTSEKLFSSHAADISLSRINSGSAIYQPTPRGKYTFVRPADWPPQTGPRSGKLLTQVAEVAVNYAVAPITDIAVKVSEMSDGEAPRTIWRSR